MEELITIETAKLAMNKGYSIPTESALYKVISTGTECVRTCRDISDGGAVYEMIGFIPVFFMPMQQPWDH
jgi:hypothetical protein